MRIAMVTPVYPPYTGGIGRVAEAQTQALKALGHEVHILSPNTLPALFSYGNAAVTPRLFFALKGYDVIHLHYPCYGMDVFAALASVFWRTPLLLTYHMKTQSNDWRNIVFMFHRMFCEPFILWIAKKVFVSTKEYAESARLRHPALREMPFSVDTERFSPGFSGPRESPSHLKFLFVGGLDRAHDFKGVDILLSALAKLPQTAKLSLVGDGDRRPFYEALAQELGIASRVHFLGQVSDHALPDVYRAHDVHVLPSVNRGEAFGLVTLEAAASGLPSLVSDIPGVRTLIEPHKTGELVVPGDVESLKNALERFVSHPEDASLMGAAARVRASEVYSAAPLARTLLKAYNEAMGGGV